MLELLDNFSRQQIIDNFLTIVYMSVRSEILDFVLLRQLRACTNTSLCIKFRVI
jgi:hypothetical protein